MPARHYSGTIPNDAGGRFYSASVLFPSRRGINYGRQSTAGVEVGRGAQGQEPFSVNAGWSKTQPSYPNKQGR